MTVLLDTGPLVAYLDPDDARHDRAQNLIRPLLAGRMGLLMSTDFVYDEGMTLIRIRKRSRPLLESYHALFWAIEKGQARPFETVTTSMDQCRKAGEYHLQHYDQKLSLTDCTLILHASQRNAVIATFDGRIDGLAATVPEDRAG